MRNMPRLVSGVVVEVVGDDVLVVVPGTTDALSLSGEAAKTVLTIQAGQSVSSSDPVVGELVARGVIEVPGLSRRGLIRAGAVGAGAGIAVFALPSVAAASSPVQPPSPPTVVWGVYTRQNGPTVPTVRNQTQVNMQNPPSPLQNDTLVVNFLTRNNLPLDTPNFPSPIPSQDFNDISALSVQATSNLAAFTIQLEPTLGNVNDNVIWQDLTVPTPWDINEPAPDLVATFSWAGEQFKIYLACEI